MTEKPTWSSHPGFRPMSTGSAATPDRDALGAVLAKFNAGRFADAEAGARTLTRRFPHHPFGWKVMGAALKQLGRLDDALPAMRQAAGLARNDAEAHANLGIVLLNLGRLAEAEAALRQALKLKPGYTAVHSNLGAVLLGLGRPAESEDHYRRTLQAAPDHPETHNNLGIALFDQGRVGESMACIRRALALAPDYAPAHSSLGTALTELGHPTDARLAFGRAWRLDPGSPQYALQAHLLLPVIQDNAESIGPWRVRYRQGITALDRVPISFDGAVENINLTSFYLAYHGLNDRPIMEALARLFRSKAAGLTMTAPRIAGWRAPATGERRLRVGIVSEFFYMHTVGELFRGLIRHLDRDRFEVTVVHAPRSIDDEFRRDVDTFADKSMVLPADLKEQQKAVAAEGFDALFYPDIGMTSSTYFLAFARLAPVQAVSFGHPVTTGLDTMDYFVSAAPMEPEGADDHYTERLIRLNRMPVHYRAPTIPAVLKSRADLGLPESVTLYGCPQSLFKFHPDFDPILAAIAEGDPAGHIVLIEGVNPNWSRLLRERWAHRFPALVDRVRFLPRLSLDDFMALMSHLDVGLDPIHFGGGNTFYEAEAFGLPVVSWAGGFMRSRITPGAYRQMGVADAPVVTTLADYAPTVLALGRDPERRGALRRALKIAAARDLYDDKRAVAEFECFLEAAIAAAGRGEKLPKGWRPSL